MKKNNIAIVINGGAGENSDYLKENIRGYRHFIQQSANAQGMG